MTLPSDTVGEGNRFFGCPARPFVRSFIRSFGGQILLPRYPTNGLNNFDKTDRKYLLAPIDDLLRF